MVVRVVGNMDLGIGFDKDWVGILILEMVVIRVWRTMSERWYGGVDLGSGVGWLIWWNKIL